jgi:2'-5' RNA ligase
LTREENLNVTLFFLGFVHEEQVANVCARVGEVCAELESFELEFTSMKLMESDENPKMIWLEGEASEGLKKVREEIEKELTAIQENAFRGDCRPHARTQYRSDCAGN